MIATPYDDESLNKFQRRPNSIGEVSWGLVKPDVKKTLFEDQPRMTVAWRFKDADDYDTLKDVITEEFGNMKKNNWTITDKGKQPLSRFVGDEYIALGIWKRIPDGPDDEYYFGGEAGQKKLIDECVGRNMVAIREHAQNKSTFTPTKKRKTS